MREVVKLKCYHKKSYLNSDQNAEKMSKDIMHPDILKLIKNVHKIYQMQKGSERIRGTKV